MARRPHRLGFGERLRDILGAGHGRLPDDLHRLSAARGLRAEPAQKHGDDIPIHGLLRRFSRRRAQEGTITSYSSNAQILRAILTGPSARQ